MVSRCLLCSPDILQLCLCKFEVYTIVELQERVQPTSDGLQPGVFRVV